MWLATYLANHPINRGKYSNIKRLLAPGQTRPAHSECSACCELDPAMEGTAHLTWELLKRMGRVKASQEHLPFRVTVLFAEGTEYPGTLHVISPLPKNERDHVVRIDFDDGDVELYTQKDLYKEIAGL